MHQITRRLFMVSGCLMALLRSANSQDGLSGHKTTIYGPPAIPSLMAAYAVRHGLFDDFITDAAFQTWSNPDQMRAGLAAGRVKLAIMPTYSGANLFNKGVDIRLASVLTGGLLYLMAPRQTNITTLQDLTAKRIGIPFKNDMPDYVFKTLLQAEGLDNNSVDIRYLSSPAEAIPFLMLDKIDAAILMEPLCSGAIEISRNSEKPLVRALDMQALWRQAFNIDSLPQAGLLVSSTFFDQQSVDKLNAIFQTALDHINANPRESIDSVGHDLNFSAQLLRAALPFSNLCVYPARQQKHALEKMFAALSAYNSAIIGGKMPDEAFYL